MPTLRQIMGPLKPPKKLGIQLRGFFSEWQFGNSSGEIKTNVFCSECKKRKTTKMRRRVFFRTTTGSERFSIVRWKCQKGHVWREASYQLVRGALGVSDRFWGAPVPAPEADEDFDVDDEEGPLP